MFPFGSTIKHIELYRIIGVKISQSYHVLKVYLFIPTRESKQVTSELAIIALIFIHTYLLSFIRLLLLTHAVWLIYRSRNDQNASNHQIIFGATLTKAPNHQIIFKMLKFWLNHISTMEVGDYEYNELVLSLVILN